MAQIYYIHILLKIELRQTISVHLISNEYYIIWDEVLLKIM